MGMGLDDPHERRELPAMKRPLDHMPLATAFLTITALMLLIGFAISRDRDASEAENAKRLSGEAVAARAEGIVR